MKRYLPGALMLAVGALFIAAGLVNKEQLTVLRKAVALCLECIGLG